MYVQYISRWAQPATSGRVGEMQMRNGRQLSRLAKEKKILFFGFFFFFLPGWFVFICIGKEAHVFIFNSQPMEEDEEGRII